MVVCEVVTPSGAPSSFSISESLSLSSCTWVLLAVLVPAAGSSSVGTGRCASSSASIDVLRECMDQTWVRNLRLLLLVVLRAWFSFRRTRFLASRAPSFSALSSNCLECSSSLYFKPWTSERSSGFSTAVSRALCSSMTWSWRASSRLATRFHSG